MSHSLLVLPSGFPPHHYTGTQWDTLSGFSSVFATPKLQQHLTPVTDIDDQFTHLEVPSLNVHDLVFSWFFSSPSDYSPSSHSSSSSPPASFCNTEWEVHVETMPRQTLQGQFPKGQYHVKVNINCAFHTNGDIWQCF